MTVVRAGVACQWGIHDSGAVTKGGERSWRGEFLSERAGVAEGAWWSEQSGSPHRALREGAWRRAPDHPPATGRGDSPLVHLLRVTV